MGGSVGLGGIAEVEGAERSWADVDGRLLCWVIRVGECL